jgi:exo-beta-1,3-glucanase (GH17 family)
MRTFTEHVIDFVRTNDLARTIYIFEAFDESEKPGAAVERNFGIANENR